MDRFKIKIQYLCLALLLFLANTVLVEAQTRVVGKVIDEQGEPIPFANIIFKKSMVGTYSNQKGEFTLYSQKNYNAIEVSSVGYTTKEIKLKSNDNHLQVVLVMGEELEEVVVVQKPTKNLSKKENPAYPILQKIWANKYKNALSTAKAYQYRRYETVELGLIIWTLYFLKKLCSLNIRKFVTFFLRRNISNTSLCQCILRKKFLRCMGITNIPYTERT